MDYNECCRSCLQPISVKVNLLTDIKIRNLYEDCARITVNNEDTLPKYLCFICFGKCSKWKEFQEECTQNEDFLKNWSLIERKSTLKLTEIEFLNVEIKEESESDDERLDLMPTHNDESDSEDSKLKSVFLNTICEVKLEDIGERREISTRSKVVINDELMKFEVIPKRVKKLRCNPKSIFAPKRVIVNKNTDLSKLNVSNKLNYSERFENESAPVNYETWNLNTGNKKPNASKTDREETNTISHNEVSQPVISEIKKLNSENIVKAELLSSRKSTKRVYCEESDDDRKRNDDKDNDFVIGRKTILPKSVFRCTICKKLFSRLEVYELHFLCVHMEKAPFECQICFAKYARSNKLDDHLLKEHVPMVITPQFFCSDCEQGFATELQLKRHSKVHIVHSCDKCGKMKIFNKRQNLLDHIKKFHSNKDKIMHPCPQCERIFVHKSSMDTHIKQDHLKDLRFICNFCGKLFGTNSKLLAHLRTHSEERPHICTVCSKSFKTKANLRLHITLHTGERPFKCPHCEKSFRDSKVMKHHSMTHTGERPHVCLFCNHGFIQRTAWKNHMESHQAI